MGDRRKGLPEKWAGWKPPPPRDSWRDAVDKAREWRDASMEQRARAIEDAVELAFALLEHRPDREQILAYQEPLPPDSVALIERMVAEHRKTRSK